MRKLLIFTLIIISTSIFGESITCNIAGKIIYLPVPHEFYNIPDSNYSRHEYVKSMIPSNTRLLDFWISKKDIDDLNWGGNDFFKRYIYVTVAKNAEKEIITQETFDYVKESIVDNLSEFSKIDENYYAEMIKKYRKWDQDKSFNITKFESTYLGINITDSKSVCFSALMDSDLIINGQSVHHLIITSASMVFVNGKILNIYVCSSVQDTNDISWAIKALNGIVQEVKQLNKQ